jgi:hypothetical protein
MLRETIQPVFNAQKEGIAVTRIHAVLLVCIRNTAAPYAVTPNERIVEIFSNPACFQEMIGRNQHVEAATDEHPSLYLVSDLSDGSAVQVEALGETYDVQMGENSFDLRSLSI